MDMKKNEIINVFSFESGSDNDIRDVFDENDIEIISTDGDGNILFLVYGYMNRGGHEGKVGIALYQYDRSKDVVTELAFVPSTKPYYILKESMGKFAYIKEDSLLYIMLGDSIYTVTFDSNEYYADDYSMSLKKTSDPGATLFVLHEGVGKVMEYNIKL